jgi:hypothetical protein
MSLLTDPRYHKLQDWADSSRSKTLRRLISLMTGANGRFASIKFWTR